MLFIYLTIFTLGIFSWESHLILQEDTSTIINEKFSDLENWETFSFSGSKNPTGYIINKASMMDYLKIISKTSASGLIYKDHYNPNEYPILTWRWRVESVISEADGKNKTEDDYAIRLFVMFDDDSIGTSFWTSIRNSAIKLMYGTEPPETSLCFVWANIHYDEKYFDSPYSETVKILPMEMGKERLNYWYSYNVNIATLYREVFNRSCPTSAKLALMGDTDNTESQTLAYVDYIKVSAGKD
jgi:hypothetical protein